MRICEGSKVGARRRPRRTAKPQFINGFAKIYSNEVFEMMRPKPCDKTTICILHESASVVMVSARQISFHFMHMSERRLLLRRIGTAEEMTWDEAALKVLELRQEI